MESPRIWKLPGCQGASPVRCHVGPRPPSSGRGRRLKKQEQLSDGRNRAPPLRLRGSLRTHGCARTRQRGWAGRSPHAPRRCRSRFRAAPHRRSNQHHRPSRRRGRSLGTATATARLAQRGQAGRRSGSFVVTRCALHALSKQSKAAQPLKFGGGALPVTLGSISGGMSIFCTAVFHSSATMQMPSASLLISKSVCDRLECCV